MSNFQNTEQTYSTSGVNAIWLAPNTSFLTHFNSGGLTNIAGPALIKAIIPVSALGVATGPTNSGDAVIVLDAISGAASGGSFSGQAVIYRFLGTQSGATVVPPAPVTPIDYLARSGVSIFVGASGFTHTTSVNILYAAKQA